MLCVSARAAEQEDEEPEELATGRWDLNQLVVSPGNPLVSFFDLIVAVCVVFSSVVAPMKVAYRAKFLPELEVLTDAVFWLDIALQFCSGFEERGYPSKNQTPNGPVGTLGVLGYQSRALVGRQILANLQECRPPFPKPQPARNRPL